MAGTKQQHEEGEHRQRAHRPQNQIAIHEIALASCESQHVDAAPARDNVRAVLRITRAADIDGPVALRFARCRAMTGF